MHLETNKYISCRVMLFIEQRLPGHSTVADGTAGAANLYVPLELSTVADGTTKVSDL